MEARHTVFSLRQRERRRLILVEKEHLFKLYQEDKISLEIRNRLLDRMDHRISHIK